MKLSDHVEHIRTFIYKAYSNQFSRLGIGPNKELELERIPAEYHNKREKVDVLIKSHIDEVGSYEEAREKALDELTFTLFNRLAAIKVMEAHQLFPPIVTKQAEHGDRSFGHKAWLEQHPEMRSEELEGLRSYFKDAFNQLGESIPLYHKNYPYALLPYVIDLNQIIDAFNEVEQDAQIEDAIWESDDILGWLYESYNNAKKIAFKESNEDTEYDKVSLQSQFYTPRWVVEFLVENSLGKLYLEMHPDSEIKDNYKIANAPQTRTREPKPLHEIKLIDPSSGSGNFLLYAFEFFYKLYEDQIDNYDADYDEDDIAQLIIEKNLHGIDLDDRAIQLAQLGLWIKARQKIRSTGRLKFNVVSSDFFLPEYTEVQHIFEGNQKIDSAQRNLIENIWSDLQQAYKFGSLVKIGEKLKHQVEQLYDKQNRGETDLFLSAEISQYEIFEKEFFTNLETAVTQFASQQGNSFLTDKTKDAITFLKLITQKYDVAAANPPYTDSRDFGPDLKKFIEANYKKPYKFNTNLYATFIKRCFELTNEHGKVAMIHPLSFMYVKTFEDVRGYILNNSRIESLIELGLGGVFVTTKVDVDVVAYILTKKIEVYDNSYFMNLQAYEYRGLKTKNKVFEDAFHNYLSSNIDSRNYELNQNKFRIIKTYPFIYWISDEFRTKFKEDSVKDILKNCQGLATADNNRFLRFWWEVMLVPKNGFNHKWYLYAKGGPFRKWYGNLWLMVNWRDEGRQIKNFTDKNGKQRSRPQNESLYFKKGITYSASGQKGPSYRQLPENCIFDVGGSSIFPIKLFQNHDYVLAFFNSNLSKYIIECLNPTVNKQVGDIERVPFVIPQKKQEEIVTKLAGININIKSKLDSYRIYDFNFQLSPLNFLSNGDFKTNLSSFFNYENYLNAIVYLNEALINKVIHVIYDLTEEDINKVITKEGIDIGSIPVSNEALNAFIEEKTPIESCLSDEIVEYINSLSRKNLLADQKEIIEHHLNSLYQNNYEMEDLCVRHEINPIELWYLFKQSHVIPSQKMNVLSIEFLSDMIRDILMEDDDGIIPLVPNAGEKILLDRIEERFIEKGFSMAQYSSFDNLVGRELNEFINKYFFSKFCNSLNLFRHMPLTPFIWHLSSGPEQGFDCYLIIYKWSRDRLLSIRSVYIENRERALVNRQTDLRNKTSLSAKEQDEADKVYKQLREIESFKVKIDELLAEGYNPILDDGVGKNIAPLQNKGMLPYEVLNKGQLKKYLNADW
jgi:hypothetical protein